MANIKGLIGKRFGHLKVASCYQSGDDVFCHCMCDCGGNCHKRLYHLNLCTEAMCAECKKRKSAIVYFLYGESTDRIKIGYTTVKLSERLAACQTGSPVKLHPIGSIKYVDMKKMGLDTGNAPDSGLHKKFIKDRSHGEWFNISKDILDFLEDNAFRFPLEGRELLKNLCMKYNKERTK
jgi:T5orf172 domain